MATARTKVVLVHAARISAAFATVMTGKAFSPADFMPEEVAPSQPPKMSAELAIKALIGRYCN